MSEGRRYSCHCCGTASFRDGRREPEFECDACDTKDGKFSADDIHLYVSCRCGAKLSRTCLDLFGKAIEELEDALFKDGDELDDCRRMVILRRLALPATFQPR